MNIIHECRAQFANDILRWPFKITRLAKFPGSLLILMALIASVQAGGSVTLAWNRSTNAIVAGYNVYFGGKSGAYTNEICAGNATNATISGLVQGATYYFAATTYAATGIESPFSSEVSYTVSATNNLPIVALTAPANGAGYPAPATINLAASVTTNGHSITKVQFYNGATLLGEDTSAPYSFTWSNVASGNYSLTAGVVYDSSGSTVASSPVSITVTSVTAVTTIWPGTAVPAVVDGGPDSAVELGVKFRSDVAGNITGIRFYKASANTGTHVGNLWTSTGALLATATFTGETASGWQQVNFATPVSITANTVYVASCHANNGHYSADNNYFSVHGVDNPPLHALANGVSGGNGVSAYGASSVFPNQTWNARNYWVDVVLQAGLPVPGMQLRVTPTRQFILTVNGPVGQAYKIQATQDFKTWTVIGTVTVGASGSSVFTDTNAASFSRRFYRTQ